MKLPGSLTSLLALLVASALANTEKVIFTAPNAISFTNSDPTLDVLQLRSITHSNNALRTSLNVAFPGAETPQGTDHWFLLRDLNSQQRYELRVCWAAVVRISSIHTWHLELLIRVSTATNSILAGRVQHF
jgi:hypothetical protein